LYCTIVSGSRFGVAPSAFGGGAARNTIACYCTVSSRKKKKMRKE
jgi:hypothetical protein